MENDLDPVWDMDEQLLLLVAQMLLPMVFVVHLLHLRQTYHQVSVFHDLQVQSPLPHEPINELVMESMGEYHQISVLLHVLLLRVVWHHLLPELPLLAQIRSELSAPEQTVRQLLFLLILYVRILMVVFVIM